MSRPWAEAELHYIDFGSEAVFRELTRRHRLRYAGRVDCCPVHNHEWVHPPTHLVLRTRSDPRCDCYRRAGYASYVDVSGDMPSVKALYTDVIESAEGIKGEFKPLTLASGEVVAENWRGRDGI